MSEPRHISACVAAWLDQCPFNLPDALQAIRDELEPPAAKQEQAKKELRDPEDVVASHLAEEKTA